ncbi:MAG: hypothetical protein EOP33_00380 [Rickettsiaceae bacterium]|nr:MAG: hypothetical protein EOP33_00380 [Rickettsiaceae bacterium]
MINYQELLSEPIIDFLRKLLIKVQQDGLSDNNHFYISFTTKDTDVKLSDKMLVRYPKEITIILQNQFEILSVTLHGFSVKLSFDGIPEIVEIPFRCVNSFSDPGANINLQFRNQLKPIIQIETKTTKNKVLFNKTQHVEEGSNIIMLDSFRKNKKPE